ncbi:MAG: ketoacyl-ACP synthase III [Alphaproteobacteria bacterium]|nr:ketoacyl-ACP synthase III [Alphaproteobacteria bacterium]
MTQRSVILGCGHYLPRNVWTNDDLRARGVDTTDEWIQQRTGIKQRHAATENEKTSDLAIAAARMALHNAGITADQLDGIVLATTTPDCTFPATAVKVQAALGMTRGFAFDVQSVCSGFLYALSVANNFIITGQAKHLLVIGAETLTRLLNWHDRTTCVLFGDGAGAVVLGAATGTGTVADRGILSTHLHSDGRTHDLLYTNGGPGSNGQVGTIQMEGKEVFKHAVTRLAEVVDEALNANHLNKSDIDWLIPHQANERIILAMAEKLSLPTDRVIITIGEHANTSAASVPLALAHGQQKNKFKPGQLLLLETMGAGLSWGAALIRW